LPNFLTKEAPYKGPGADSEEKREPVSDTDIAVADSLKVLDLKRPIREADIHQTGQNDAIDPSHTFCRVSDLGCLGQSEPVGLITGSRVDPFQVCAKRGVNFFRNVRRITPALEQIGHPAPRAYHDGGVSPMKHAPFIPVEAITQECSQGQVGAWH